MVDTQQALERGRGLHRAGRLNEAESIYRQVLAADPENADGLHLLGVMAHQRGQNELAIDLIGKAIAHNSAVADFHCNFGNAMRALGRHAEAETHYRRALRLNPTHVESYNNLGNALSAQGRIKEAEQQFRRALGLRPGYAVAHFNLADSLCAQGRTKQAVTHYQQAVGLFPAFPAAHFNLALALHTQGKLAEAAASCREAIAIEPNWAHAHRRLGAIQRQLNRPIEAEASYRRAHELAPQASHGLLEWAELLDSLGRIGQAVEVRQHLCNVAPQSAQHWFELGLALQRASRAMDARQAYLHAQAIDPDYPYLRNNLAATYVESGQPSSAIDILDSIVAGGSDDVLSFINLGIACRQTFNLSRSVEMFERAIALDPRNPLGYSNYGLTLSELQRPSEARAMFERSLAADPNFVGARWNLAMSQLLAGDYATGWVNHEARWDGSPELRGNRPGAPQQPIWEGEPLTGKTLFLWGEQGFGDALQFSRYVPLLADRVKREGGHLFYCCFGRLLPLFRRSFEDCCEMIIPDTCRPMPETDYHCPLLSLPLRFGTTLDTVPARVPYLRLDKQKVEAWRERLAAERRLKVGLVWTGNPTHQRNPFRSVDLDAYVAAFKDIRDVSFYSLQFDAEQDIKKAQANGFAIEDHTPEMKDYDDSAAFIRNMDLVITICTSAAHLAGAVAARTWLLLDVNPHWVWLTERSDSPWYPTLTLYRQKAYRDWAPVLERVRSDLAALAQQHVPKR